jgi:two-component system sensor histidine kinase BaeS
MPRLALKLAGAFVLVAVVAVALAAYLVSRSTQGEFGLYLQHIGRMGQGMMRGMGQMMGLGQDEQTFLQDVNRSLWAAGLLAAGVAAALALLFSRLLVQPLRRMARVAKKMAGGDFSERVEIGSRDEVGELGRAMNAMAEALGKQEELRRVFVAEVAHELRTPLTVIQGNMEAMVDGVLPATQEHLSSLNSQVLVLSRLVTDLRTLSLADAGRLEVKAAPLDIGEIAGQALEVVGPQAGEKGIRLEKTLPPALPLVLADPQRVLQVFHNLLANALRYTPVGGHIRLEAKPGPGELVLSISDTGPGIPPEDIPYLFQRFHRHHSGGSGIGLAVVKALVEAQRGRVWAESQVGQGSTFYFTLPLAEPK